MKKINDTRKPKTAYQWHVKTMEYMGTCEAAPDPYNVENWSFSGNSTPIEPPSAKSGYSIVWDGEKWKSVKAAK